MNNTLSSQILEVAEECEIQSSRVFNVSREKLFRAWTEAEHLKNWWGPAGFTNTFHEFDPRPGGRWRFTMHGPEKGNYENEAVFFIVDKPSLIAWNRVSQPIFQVVASFEEIGPDKTNLVFRMLFENAKECATIRKYAVEKNEENFDKLERVLDNMS